jgi:hypothetical protein
MAFKSILAILEAIGEWVAAILGLDDSKYQYMIDEMSEEQLKQAIEVNRLREQEDVMLKVNSETNTLELGKLKENES